MLVLCDNNAVVVSLFQVVASLGITDVAMKSWTLSIVSVQMTQSGLLHLEKLQAIAAVDVCHIGRTGLGAEIPRIA